jgi:hypothetical protein
MSKQIRQALIAVGGTASRLKAGGVDVPVTKSFLPLAGRPLLFWNLCSLYQAGIRSLVIAGQTVAALQAAGRTLRSLPYRFPVVVFFHDFGQGVHGLPYQARYLLEAAVLFDCGHGLSAPDHYRGLMRAKQPGNVVFSAFTPHPDNPRQPVRLSKESITLMDRSLLLATPGPEALALAHPFIIDQDYARRLLELDFNITSIIRSYVQRRRLRYIPSDVPPEFDLASELAAGRPAYESLARRLNAAIKPGATIKL